MLDVLALFAPLLSYAVFWEIIWMQWFWNLKKKSTKLNIERWQFALRNCLIGDDLMEDFAKVFLEHYKRQANQPCVLLVPRGLAYGSSPRFSAFL